MSDKGLARSMTVRCKLVGGSREQGGCGAWMTSKDPIVLDRSRKVHPAPIARKPAPMLDLIKMTVSLTVSSGLPSKNARRNKDLAAQLMTEWE